MFSSQPFITGGKSQKDFMSLSALVGHELKLVPKTEEFWIMMAEVGDQTIVR